MPDITIFRDNAPGPKTGITIRYKRRGSTFDRRVGPGGSLTSTEAATYLKVSLRWVYKLIENGKLEPERVGAHLMFRLRDLKVLEKARRKRGGKGKEELFLIG